MNTTVTLKCGYGQWRWSEQGKLNEPYSLNLIRQKPNISIKMDTAVTLKYGHSQWKGSEQVSLMSHAKLCWVTFLTDPDSEPAGWLNTDHCTD